MTLLAIDVVARVAAGLVAISAVALVLSLASPGAGRRRRVGYLLGSVLLLAHALVAESVASETFPGSADLPVLDWMTHHRTPPFDWLFIQISAGGGTVGMAVLATVAAVGFWATHHRRAALVTVGAALGAALLVVAFKNLYGRSRPPLAGQLVPQTSLSFPSGHALGSIVVVGVVAILLGSRLSSRAPRILVAILGAMVIALIGLSRLYLGVHWLSDVLASWTLGGAWLVLCTVIALPRGPARTPWSDAGPQVDRTGAVPAVGEPAHHAHNEGERP